MSEININQIIRSKRRTVSLEITTTGNLIVRAPMRISVEYIKQLVQQKYEWIKRKQNLVTTKYAKIKPKEFINGEQFLYLDKHYPLNITAQTTNIKLTDYLYFPQHMLNNPKHHLVTWYKAEALTIIKDRINHYINLMPELEYKAIKISNAEKRWGSCSAKNNLNFNWRLIMAPIDVIDYVVVHELMHIQEKNHSRKFWAKVAAILPDYKTHNQWLKLNNSILLFPQV